jgi:transcriptional regulator with XRE-family HTH domain
MLNLKQILKKKNISQVEVSDALGVSKVTVNKWAQNKVYPSLEMIEKLCQYLDVSIQKLVIIEKNEKH